MKKRRFVSCGLAAAMLISTISGCSAKTQTKEPAKAGTETAANTESAAAQLATAAENSSKDGGNEEKVKRHVKIYTQLTEANASYWVWDDALKAYQAEVNPNFIR